MSTLAEIVNAYEICLDEGCNQGCGDCVYKSIKHGNCKNIRNNDALKFLKRYYYGNKALHSQIEYYFALNREIQNICEKLELQVKHLVNIPLPWDELRVMIGKPVWIERFSEQGKWYLIRSVNKENMILLDKIGECTVFERNKQGESWQAFTKDFRCRDDKNAPYLI